MGRIVKVSALCLLILIVFPTLGFGASDCTKLIPAGGAYDSLRSWSSSDLQLAIDDYVFRKDYKTHDEAINDGLSVGAIVYGVPLKIGNDFSQTQKDKWKEEYRSRQKLNKVIQNRGAFEQLTLNKDAIREISACIIATSGIGLQANYEMVGDCAFKYSAWYRSEKKGDSAAQVLAPLSVSPGIQCDPWPSKEVLPGALTTICRRSGRAGGIVTLPTDAGSASVSIPPLPDPGPPPSGPVYQTIYETHQDEFRADKNSSFTGAGLGEGSEVRVVINAPGEVTDVSYRCEGEACGWVYVCPDGGKCGGITKEFENNGNTVIFHAWSNSGAPAMLIFPYTYRTSSRQCTEHCNYQADLAQWQQQANHTCPALQ